MRHVLLLSIVFLVASTSPRLARAQGDAVALDEAGFIAALERAAPERARVMAAIARGDAEVVAAGVRPNPDLQLEREQLLSEARAATSYARVAMPIDLAGRRTRRVAVARAEVDAVRAEVDAVRAERVIDGLRRFTEASYAARVVALLQADRGLLVRAVDIVRKRGDAGAGAGYDVQRIELELAAYDDQLATAEGAVAVAQAQLGALIGVAAVAPTSDLALPVEPPPIAALMAGAVEGRGDYRAAAARAAGAAAMSQLAGRGWIPDLDVVVGAMATDGAPGAAVGVTLGVSVSLPVFDRGQGAAAQARAAHQVATAEQQWLVATVPAQISIARDALVRLRAQAERLGSAQLARLDPLLRAAETGYREGASGIIDLLDAYRVARGARLRELELRRDARLAELDLWHALGRRP
ncbi:MAG: TolC family protein [Myxococcales bacterium]|nr:TolC family protein [Myxococcales bacterium]